MTLEAMKIDPNTYNYAKAIGFQTPLNQVNGSYLVREKGTNARADQCSIFDKHEFHARFAWIRKTYGGEGFEEIAVLPEDENGFPEAPYYPGNLDPGFRRG